MGKYSTALVMIIFQLTGIFSCSEELKPTPYVYTKIFTGENSKTWKCKFLEQTLNGSITDTFTVSCSTDDLYTFFANPEHSYQVKTGLKKCFAPPEADVINDTWNFNNASATLSMILPFFDDTSPLPFILIDVTKSKMVTEIFLDQNNTESYRIHFESTNEN